MPQKLTFYITWLLLSLLTPPRATAQAPARPDSARAQMLSTDTRTLRQLDSLRRQTTARLGQLQQELLSLKDRPDRAREQRLAQEFVALRAADSLRRTTSSTPTPAMPAARLCFTRASTKTFRTSSIRPASKSCRPTTAPSAMATKLPSPPIIYLKTTWPRSSGWTAGLRNLSS